MKNVLNLLEIKDNVHTVVGRGEQSLLVGEPGFELRVGRENEKKKGENNTICMHERFAISREILAHCMTRMYRHTMS